MLRLFFAVSICAVLAPTCAAQTTVSGSSMVMKSTGGGSGTWTIDRNGYVGTYVNVTSPGNVTVRVNASGTASGGINPHMNIVLADTKAGFDVVPGINPYEHTFNLPVGTYFLRTEFSNDQDVSTRALAVQDVTVSGATVSNISSNANALAAADSYVQNFRKGTVKVGLSGLAPGSTVSVSLKRHAFSFGTAVPGFSSTDVNNYLGSNGTTKQNNYQSRLNQNFNALVPENIGKWAYNEAGRDTVTMNGVDQILNYAQSHNMRARMHNMIWGDNGTLAAPGNGQQPSWVLNNSSNGLLDLAYLGNATAKTDLRDEISERIDYYVGTGTAADRAHKYYELDVYNESYHTGSDPNLPDGNPATEADLRHNYWNVYQAAGVADIYREARDTITASGAKAKVFVNEYGSIGGSDYAPWYMNHIEQIRQAGIVAGYGDVVGGIGIQHYPGGSQNAGNIMRTLQNLSVQGLPLSLTEFGVTSGVSESTAATILGDILRLAFGTSDATGFFMWGFHQESGSGATTLFAPAAALYTVNTSNFNAWTLTPAGQKWQDQLGIQDWDGNANNGWTTQLSTVVAADGTISFDGFWGDYQLTINSQTYNLSLSKGQNLYSLVIKPGDYNADGVVDSSDYVIWRRALDSGDLRADGNGNGVIDPGDYDVWRLNFGVTYSSGSGLGASVPEPSAALLMLMGGFISAVIRVRSR